MGEVRVNGKLCLNCIHFHMNLCEELGKSVELVDFDIECCYFEDKRICV